MRTHSEWKIRLGLTLLVFAALACNLPFQRDMGRTFDETELEEENSQENELESEVEGEQASEPEDVPEGMDLAPCPAKEGAMILKFSAVLQIEAGEAKMIHTLDDGILSLWVDDGPGPVYPVRSLEPAPIPYKITGTMGECSLNGVGMMTPDAYGTCEAGVVLLTIIEDWGAAQGTVTCDEATQEFPMPAIGKMEHSGSDGYGEVFFLDRGFSEVGPGMTSIRPFAMGEGEHIWTIFVDPYFVKP